MKEIKFRAWDKRKKEFVYTTDGGHIVYNNKMCTNDYGDFLGNDDYEDPEQFTGLYDKKRTPEFPNGQEIWECDVVIQKFEKYIIQGFGGECSDIYGFHRGTVKISPSKGTVISPCYTEFDEDSTSIDYYKKPRTQYGVNIVGHRCEVIGNIHDKE